MGNKVRQLARRQARKRRQERRLTKREQRVDKQISSSLKHRHCNQCQACCTVMAVKEIDKPLGEPCKHLCEKGCSIYEDRPEPCREFNCCWRMGLGETNERPDLIGIVFDVTSPNPVTPQGLVAREVWPGAFKEQQLMLQRLVSQGHLIFLIKGDRRTAMGPPHLLAQVQHIVNG